MSQLQRNKPQASTFGKAGAPKDSLNARDRAKAALENLQVRSEAAQRQRPQARSVRDVPSRNDEREALLALLLGNCTC